MIPIETLTRSVFIWMILICYMMKNWWRKRLRCQENGNISPRWKTIMWSEIWLSIQRECVGEESFAICILCPEMSATAVRVMRKGAILWTKNTNWGKNQKSHCSQKTSRLHMIGFLVLIIICWSCGMTMDRALMKKLRFWVQNSMQIQSVQ